MPCALRVSNQSGRSYSTVAMEYAKGKISARGREISWLNHPCYLGYKGEVGYKHNYIDYQRVGRLYVGMAPTHNICNT